MIGLAIWIISLALGVIHALFTKPLGLALLVVIAAGATLTATGVATVTEIVLMSVAGGLAVLLALAATAISQRRQIQMEQIDLVARRGR